MERSLLLRLVNQVAAIFSVLNMIFPKVLLPSIRGGDLERASTRMLETDMACGRDTSILCAFRSG